jgi:hypothetical protein
MVVTIKYGDDRHRKPHGSSWSKGVIVVSLNGTLFECSSILFDNRLSLFKWSGVYWCPLEHNCTLRRLTRRSTTVYRLLQACMHCLSYSDSRGFMSGVPEYDYPDSSPNGGHGYIEPAPATSLSALQFCPQSSTQSCRPDLPWRARNFKQGAPALRY